MLRTRIPAVAVLAGLVIVLGNGVRGQAGAKTAGKSPAGGRAHVRIVHAVPDAPPVDVYLGSRKVLSQVPYRSVSRYLPLPAGTHQINVTAANTAGTIVSVLKFPITVEAGEAYTAAAAGTLRTLQPVLLTDDLAPTGGAAQLRVVHLAPDVPAVDVVEVLPKGAKEIFLYKGAAYPKATAYRPIRAGSHTLEIRPSGSPYPVKEDIAARVPARAHLSAFAFGLLKGEEKQAFTVTVVPDVLGGK